MGEFKFKQKNFLGINDIWKDVKELSQFFKILMGVGIVIILFFNFFDVQGSAHGSYFVPTNQYRGVLNGGFSLFGNDKSGAMAVAIIYSLNGVAAFTGLLSVAMIVNGKTSQYFWGMMNAIFFGVFALSVGYVGDFIMNIILLLGAPLGWYLFEIKGLANKESKKHSIKFNILFYTALFFIAMVVILAWYEMIPPAAEGMFKTDPYEGHDGKILQTLDAITNGLNSTGYVMQLTNMDEQFYIWFFVNISKIMKFTGLAEGTLNINMLLQFTVWFTMALIGLYKRNLETFVNAKIKEHKDLKNSKKAY